MAARRYASSSCKLSTSGAARSFGMDLNSVQCMAAAVTGMFCMIFCSTFISKHPQPSLVNIPINSICRPACVLHVHHPNKGRVCQWGGLEVPEDSEGGSMVHDVHVHQAQYSRCAEHLWETLAPLDLSPTVSHISSLFC